MVKISSIFGLGILVALIQYTGFPIEVKNWIYLLTGLLIAVLSLMIRKELHEVLRSLHSDTFVKTDTFTESTPKQTTIKE